MEQSGTIERLPAEAPIKVAIDARPMGGAPCGFTIYLGSVIECLRAPAFEITLLSNRPVQSIYPEIKGLRTLVFGHRNELRWEHTSLPKVLAENRFDIYFAGANRGIPWRKLPATRYILALLDVIPYKFFREYFVKRATSKAAISHIAQETLSQFTAISRADTILTISEQSAADIRSIFRKRNVSSILIRLAPRDASPPAVIEPHFAYLGGIDFRKQVVPLLHGFARFHERNPAYRLMMIGSNYDPLRPLIAQLGLEDHIVLTGYVDHETKFRLLERSIAMVYPSLYEGYGLAIAEGFQAGIPVIAGRGGSQEQIGGIGARHIDPCSPEDIAEAMEEMLVPAVRRSWVERGQAQLKMLTDPGIEAGLVRFFLEQGRLARQRGT
jgi:glycosyltransferase involved in cell wall biosynthesis